jgi:nitrite reductase/ring-hydroxylating ferredoxin subunit
MGRIKGEPLTGLPQIDGAWTLQEDKLVIDLAKLPELADLGGAARIEGDVLAQPVLVFQGEDSNYYAIENACPHAGRKIDPIVGTMTLECCSISSSTFDYAGNVLSGPAEASLKLYDVSVADEQLFITLN